MENLLKPEIFVPIFLNIILALTTIFYLAETRSTRKAITNQLDVARRQHFVTTAPFIFASSLEIKEGSNELKIKMTNPSEKLARDVKYIIFEASKKTFRAPDKSNVVIKPGTDSTVTVPAEPFTKAEVENKLKKFYDLQQIEKDILSEGRVSYVLLVYTDVEGSVYTVKANFTQNEEDEAFSRQRSRFKKIYDPRS